MPDTPLRLINPVKVEEDHAKVWLRIPPQVNDYLFNHVLTGTRNPHKQTLCSLFFIALYEECQRRNIPKVFDEDNESRIAAIMSDLNFRPAPTGRADLPTPVDPAQPAGDGDVDGAVDGPRKTTTKRSKQPGNPVRGNRKGGERK